jgi:hypothetical protein
MLGHAVRASSTVAVVPVLQGQRNFPGLWWSATTGEHVAYESWVERDVAMLLDFDPQIVAFAAQPFGFAGPTAAATASMRRTSSLAWRTAPAWSSTCGLAEALVVRRPEGHARRGLSGRHRSRWRSSRGGRA